MQKRIRYTERHVLVRHIFIAIDTVLSAEERQILLLFCGFGKGGPLRFIEIADRLSLPSAQYAAGHCRYAAQKVRAFLQQSEAKRYFVLC